MLQTQNFNSPWYISTSTMERKLNFKRHSVIASSSPNPNPCSSAFRILVDGIPIYADAQTGKPGSQVEVFLHFSNPRPRLWSYFIMDTALVHVLLILDSAYYWSIHTVATGNSPKQELDEMTLCLSGLHRVCGHKGKQCTLPLACKALRTLVPTCPSRPVSHGYPCQVLCLCP